MEHFVNYPTLKVGQYNYLPKYKTFPLEVTSWGAVFRKYLPKMGQCTFILKSETATLKDTPREHFMKCTLEIGQYTYMPKSKMSYAQVILGGIFQNVTSRNGVCNST